MEHRNGFSGSKTRRRNAERVKPKEFAISRRQEPGARRRGRAAGATFRLRWSR
jgi:hypothetical protein